MTRGAVDCRCGGEQSIVVDGIVFVHVDLRRSTELFRTEDGFGREHAEAGHDHQSTRRLVWSCAESGCVDDFPSEIQAADEAVDFAERGGAGTKFEGELKAGVVACEDGVAASTGFCWREKKDTGRRCGQMESQAPFRRRIL